MVGGAPATASSGTTPQVGSHGAPTAGSHAGRAPTGNDDDAVASSGDASAADAGTDAGPVEVTLNRLPDFQKPPVALRLKVRLAAADTTASMQELAKTGFGAVELAVSLRDATSLATTLTAAKLAGIQVDLAPGGSMPVRARASERPIQCSSCRAR
jgi:hypothetical protein